MRTATAELPTRTIKTQTLRIPRMDWAAVCTGAKTELRVSRGSQKVLVPPQPLVGFSYLQFRESPQTRLLVCEDAWSEPLGAISADSLRAEGYDSIREFRRYWITRHGTKFGETRGWRPFNRVQVYKLRPFTAEDRDRFAELLLERLYGRWL